MITQLYPIYVNRFKRTLFDGTLHGFKTALCRIDVEFENLVQPMYGQDLLGTEIEQVFLSLKGCLIPRNSSEYSDSMGIYLGIIGHNFLPDAPFLPPHFSDDEL
jgi:hypothetical protein